MTADDETAPRPPKRFSRAQGSSEPVASQDAPGDATVGEAPPQDEGAPEFEEGIQGDQGEWDDAAVKATTDDDEENA